MRVLFVVFAQPGHLYPMICVAQYLERAGHQVEIASMEDVSASIAAVGLTARCHVVCDATPDRRASGAHLAALLRKPGTARRWYRLALISQVPSQLAALRDVVRATRPDVVATDPLAYAGAIVAEQMRLPWACVSTQLLSLAPDEFSCPYMMYLDELGPERERLFAAEGVAARFARGEVMSPRLCTVFATDALAPLGHAIGVGPAMPLGRRGDETDFPWERLRTDKPLVYASFGSQLAPPVDVIEAVANALDPDEADLVVSIGDVHVPSLPPHVLTVRWAPQLGLLERARVIVTHGGANSVSEALWRGVPPLVVPLGHEQALQAHLVERSGAGLALEVGAATSSAFGSALRTLLADGRQRKRAAEIGRSYASANGSQRVAELLVTLAPART